MTTLTEDTATTDSLTSIIESFSTITDTITLFKMQLSTLQQQVKTVEKRVCKELKTAKKNQVNNSKPKVKKAPSGFAKPSKVTKELCEFMNKPEGSEIARTEVTRTLVQYIKSNNLQEQTVESKNKINPDDKLKNLLGLDTVETNELTFFNIQKYMNKHFISNKPKLNESSNENESSI
jgi:chromatin remodeling complex protein RSC6